MTREQIQQLFLRCRDEEGHLDLEALMAEDSLKEPTIQRPSSREQYQSMRRMQGFPEYLIDKELETLETRKPMKFNQDRK